MLGDFFIVHDVLSAEECQQYIDFYDSLFLKRFKKFDNEDNILLYCRSGRRSLIGAEILVKNGYKKIYDLKGGVISIDKSILDFNPLDN